MDIVIKFLTKLLLGNRQNTISGGTGKGKIKLTNTEIAYVDVGENDIVFAITFAK